VERRFSIGWDASGEDVPGSVRRGRIVGPDDLDDRFFAPLEVWDSSDYEKQWNEGVARIVSGEDASALVTRLHRSAKDGSFVGEWWPMWRAGTVAVLRNQLVLPETVPNFDPLDPYRSVGPHCSETVSEWRVPIVVLQRFLTAEQ
jgi:hypothetical protein